MSTWAHISFIVMLTREKNNTMDVLQHLMFSELFGLGLIPKVGFSKSPGSGLKKIEWTVCFAVS